MAEDTPRKGADASSKSSVTRGKNYMPDVASVQQAFADAIRELQDLPSDVWSLTSSVCTHAVGVTEAVEMSPTVWHRMSSLRICLHTLAKSCRLLGRC